MNLVLEARMNILESAWSAWIQTYQFLAYWIDKLRSQRSLVPASIQQNPGISLKQSQLKCYACQVYGLLKYMYYYEYRTPISVWLSHYKKVILCHLAYLYMSLQWCCQKRSCHAFCWNPLGRLLVLIQLLVITKHLCGDVYHHQTTAPYASNTIMSSPTWFTGIIVYDIINTMHYMVMPSFYFRDRSWW